MRFPGIRRRASGAIAEGAAPEAEGARPDDEGTPAGVGGGAQRGAAGPGPPRPPTVEQRLDALRAWLARLDRKLGVRTFAGAAGLVIAIAAAAVALVLLLQLREDAATEDDVRELGEQIAVVEDAATEAAREDVESVSDQLADLEQRVTGLESERDSTDREISVLQDDIQDLRDQISELEQSPGGGGALGERP